MQVIYMVQDWEYVNLGDGWADAAEVMNGRHGGVFHDRAVIFRVLHFATELGCKALFPKSRFLHDG